MTQEEKAKRYDELKVTAQELEHDGCFDKITLFDLFPELKESEDERIRKALIHLVNSNKELSFGIDNYDGIKWSDILAWLEKQGEHAKFRDSIQVGDKVTRNQDGVLVNLSQLKRVAKPAEVQDEQKPVEPQQDMLSQEKYAKAVDECIYGEQNLADKVEPKFKVGDWIVFNGLTLYIKEVVKGYYRTISKGGITNSYDLDIDNVARLWTIKDAKDGDVLATEPIERYNSPFIAIYKKQNEEDFDSYCFIGFDGKFYKGENGHSTEEVHPATKEQRDLLFQKMREAGFEWDAEKKELKEIEQKFTDWTTEDEEELKIALNTLEEAGQYSSAKWLKTVCLVPQTMQKPWSEEDEEVINLACSILYSNFNENENFGKNQMCIGEIVDKLKSIRPQSHWKPSDEQMGVIEAVINNRSFQRRHLDSLYADLKKLRKE